MSYNDKSEPAIETLAPLQRIERRLIIKLRGAQSSVKYWQEDIVRLQNLPTRGPSTDERIRIVRRKVDKLQLELDQAIEELNVFRNLCGVVK